MDNPSWVAQSYSTGPHLTHVGGTALPAGHGSMEILAVRRKTLRMRIIMHILRHFAVAVSKLLGSSRRVDSRWISWAWQTLSACARFAPYVTSASNSPVYSLRETNVRMQFKAVQSQAWLLFKTELFIQIVRNLSATCNSFALWISHCAGVVDLTLSVLLPDLFF